MDQFLGLGVETCDQETAPPIDQSHETEDFGRLWEELMGISEDIPEIDGLTE